MRVGAAYAQRGDAGAARRTGAGPIGKLVVDVEWAALELDVGIDLLEVKAGGNLCVFEREHGLDQAGDARGGVQMADIRLERADGSSGAARGRTLECVCQCADFDGVADAGSGAVGFNIGDARRRARRRSRAPRQ